MSRDYKGTDRASGGRRNGGSLLAGILIGLVLGLGMALGVAWYINKMPSPFSSPRAPASTKSEGVKTVPAQTARIDEKASKTDDSKLRFEFYKILPGDEPSRDKQSKDKDKGSTGSGKEAFFLQAGAFQSSPDADNLKARLALLGVEASIETSAVPDKGIWHRVRVGPYTDVEELNRTRDTLKQNGVQTTLVTVRESGR